MKPIHINAEKNKISKKVILTGDPLRAEYLAKTFLTNYELVSSVRNMYYFTGYYQNELITIGGSGMGCSSIGIYAHELYDYYDVDIIIRLGTCGCYIKNMSLNQTIIATRASGENRFANAYLGYGRTFTYADSELVKILTNEAEKLNCTYIKGPIHTADIFHYEQKDDWKGIAKDEKAVGTEMESFALFAIAEHFNKKAAAVLNIATNFHTKQMISIEEREKISLNSAKIILNSFLNMV